MLSRSIACCLHNVRRLIATPRAWVALIVCALFFENQFAPIRAMLVTEHMKISWLGLLTYLFNDPVVTLVTALMLLMLLFDTPMVDETQRYIITRSGRGSWARGQIIYTLVAVALYLLILCLMVLLLVLPWADFSGGWSSGITALARDGLYEVYDTMLNYDLWLLDAYTPLSGALTGLLLHYLAYAFIALVMCAVNALARSRLGMMIAAIPVMLDSVADEYFSGRVLYALPVTLSRLSQLDYGDELGRPPVWYAFIALGALVLLTAAVAYQLLKKREIQL